MKKLRHCHPMYRPGSCTVGYKMNGVEANRMVKIHNLKASMYS